MEHPIVLATHLIFTAYGFWLPNDPRGSWSDTVRAWELLHFGPATTVTTRRSLARDDHDRQLRLAAKSALRYPPVSFTGQQALTISQGFQQAIHRSGFKIYACSILQEHVHVVVARHRLMDRQILNQLKGEASKALLNAQLHPFQNTFLPAGKRHTPWTDKGWSVFLDSTFDVQRAIRYVEKNPAKDSRPPQKWSFVVPYQPF